MEKIAFEDYTAMESERKKKELAKGYMEAAYKEKDEIKRQQKMNDGDFLRSVRDIDSSKLSNNNYKNNAERLLSNYVLSYQGKDQSGEDMGDVLVDFYECKSYADFPVEILRWNTEMIIVEISPDYANCELHFSFLLGYKPQTNDLRYIIDQTWKEQAKSTMNYLDINP